MTVLDTGVKSTGTNAVLSHGTKVLRPALPGATMTRTHPSFLSAAAARFVLTCLQTPQAKRDCDGYRYRYTGAFNTSTWMTCPMAKTSIDALSEELVADVYTPSEQSDELRQQGPMAHGGFFLGGSNDGLDVVSLCEDLIQMGYVTRRSATVWELTTCSTSDVVCRGSVAWGARQPCGGRYFRKSMEMGNPYHIDPERIYLGGVSAGGSVCTAYVDEESEIPTYIDESEPGLGGGLKGFLETRATATTSTACSTLPARFRPQTFALGRQRTACEHPWHGRRNGALRRGRNRVHGHPDHRRGRQRHRATMADSVGLDNCLIPVEGAGHAAHF